MNYFKIFIVKFNKKKIVLMSNRDKKLKNSYIKLNLKDNVFHSRYCKHLNDNVNANNEVSIVNDHF